MRSPLKVRRFRWLTRLARLIPLGLLVVGLGLIAWPWISNELFTLGAAQVVDAYDASVAATDEAALAELRQQAQRYNAELFAQGESYGLVQRMQALGERSHRIDEGTSHSDQRDLEAAAALKRYESLLCVGSDGVMGYLTIPKLRLTLPIYHGTAAEELQKGAGHLIGSSLPVGGPSTHSVIVAHSGLPTAELFSHLTDLRRGDEFGMTVLDESLLYRVDFIAVVEPDEVEDLKIQAGRDLCTLVTCTPYGINTHRLLVRGHRIDLPEGQKAAALPEDRWPMGILIVIGLGSAVGAGLVWRGLWRRRRRRRW